MQESASSTNLGRDVLNEMGRAKKTKTNLGMNDIEVLNINKNLVQM